MKREDLIKDLLAAEAIDGLKKEVAELKTLIEVFLSVIVVTQKDACAIAGITDDTIRNMVLRGDAVPLQADGSNRNFYTLKQTAQLKPRRKAKKI